MVLSDIHKIFSESYTHYLFYYVHICTSLFRQRGDVAIRKGKVFLATYVLQVKVQNNMTNVAYNVSLKNGQFPLIQLLLLTCYKQTRYVV